MLKQPYLFGEALHSLTEAVKRLAAALCPYLNRLGKVQTQNTHEALGVHLLMVIADHDLERLHGRQGNEILDFGKRMKIDVEFLQQKSS